MFVQVKSSIPPRGLSGQLSDVLLVSGLDFNARKLGNLWVFEPHNTNAMSMNIPEELQGAPEEDVSVCCHVEEKWDSAMGESVIVCSILGKPLKPYYVSYGMHGKPYSAMFSLSYPFVVVRCNAFMKIKIDKMYPVINDNKALIITEKVFNARGVIKTVFCKQHGIILNVSDGDDELSEHLSTMHINSPWRPNHDMVISEFEDIPSTYQFAVRAAVRSSILNVSHHAVRPFFSRSINEESKDTSEE